MEHEGETHTHPFKLVLLDEVMLLNLNPFLLLVLLLQSTRPLYSFEDSCDYVYDAMWSPTHPALFACVDLAGRLDLWNLNNDTEVRKHAHKHTHIPRDLYFA